MKKDKATSRRVVNIPPPHLLEAVIDEVVKHKIADGTGEVKKYTPIPGPGWACPKCKGIDLQVSVQVWRLLIQNPDDDADNFETWSIDNDHEQWDEDSLMLCRTCDYSERTAEFEL